MENNLLRRMISGLILGGIAISAVFYGGIFFVSLMSICVVAMLYEWISINQKKSLLFFLGNFYISIPILFWIYEARYFPETLQLHIFWIFTIVWTCDIFAYFGGKLIGGPKFAPSISPNKTWSGVIVGSIFSFVFSYIYISRLMDGDLKLVVASIFMITASILGDLLESKVKRVLNVKDTGNIIPGHGGVCDRLDSFLFVTYIFIIIRFATL